MSGICECSNLHPVWEITDPDKEVVAGIADPGPSPKFLNLGETGGACHLVSRFF
jgi:hypothetical protein